MVRILSGWSWIVLAFVSLSTTMAASTASPEVSFTAQERSHWALQKVVRREVPAMSGDWVRNPIDAFVLARLKAEHIEPGEPADKTTLLRRATLDLIGL